MAEHAIKTVARNRKAKHDYHILNTMEAGIVLKGTEVKSLRQGKANIKDSYARIQNGEIKLFELHISPYQNKGYAGHNPTRPRKLLLHKREIRRLDGKVEEKGLTLIPLQIYFKKGIAKVELALAKGKKAYDKREKISKRDMDNEISKVLKK